MLLFVVLTTMYMGAQMTYKEQQCAEWDRNKMNGK